MTTTAQAKEALIQDFITAFNSYVSRLADTRREYNALNPDLSIMGDLNEAYMGGNRATYKIHFLEAVIAACQERLVTELQAVILDIDATFMDDGQVQVSASWNGTADGDDALVWNSPVSIPAFLTDYDVPATGDDLDNITYAVGA